MIWSYIYLVYLEIKSDIESSEGIFHFSVIYLPFIWWKKELKVSENSMIFLQHLFEFK